MIEIGENYYLINKEEITNDMVLLTDGIYISGENYYELVNSKNDNSIASQNSNKNQTSTEEISKNQASIIITNSKSTSTALSTNHLTVLFIFSVLFIAFAVLCVYIGIINVVDYNEIINQSNQFGSVGEIIADEIKKLLRDGILWIIGGAASLILGCFLSLIYHSKS